MTLAPLETVRRLTVPASDKLAENSERIAWRSHQLAAEIADADPNAVTQTLRRAATSEWRRTFLRVCR